MAQPQTAPVPAEFRRVFTRSRPHHPGGPAARRNNYQFHRPPGGQRPRPHPPRRIPPQQQRLRRDRQRLPHHLRALLFLRRLGAGPSRRRPRPLARHLLVVDRRDAHLLRARSALASASSAACSPSAKAAPGPPSPRPSPSGCPPEARTLAIGVCNSGSSLGAMIAPPLVAWITYRYNWRAAFIVTGALGFLWVAAFLVFRRAHPEMAASEKAVQALGAAPRPLLGTPHPLPPDLGRLLLPLLRRPALVLLRLLDPRIPDPRTPPGSRAPWPRSPGSRSWSPTSPTSPAATSRSVCSAPAGAPTAPARP